MIVSVFYHCRANNNCVRLKSMKSKNSNPSIEPGILPLFRFFVLLQFAFSVFNWVRNARIPALLPRTRFPRLAEWLIERKVSGGIYLFWSVLLALFLIYLFLPQFQRWLGKAYLPLALVVQMLILFLGNDLVSMALLTGGSTVDIGTRNWILFISFLIPIIIASWQYDFTIVLILILFSTILNLLFSITTNTTPSFRFLGGNTFLLAPGILYGAIGYTITRLMKEQRALRSSLQTANQKLSNYVSTQDALATARERNRLARELHDTLAHTLSGLVIQLEAVNILWERDSQKAQNELQSLTAQARAGLNEARRAIKSLRAAPVEEMGLLLALRQAAKEAEQRGRFQMEVMLPEALPFLPPDIENDVYRVAVESLENIVQHAHARQVSLAMTLPDQSLHLQIKDDGVGFDSHAVDNRSHYGLIGLRERAELHGAELKIESHPGKGTSISFQVEVPQ